MHLTRPKSSKGRSRPAPNNPIHLGAGDGIHGPPESPTSSLYYRPDGNFRSQSQPITWQGSQDEVLNVVQPTPATPPLLLNKYKVLPSIERGRPEVNPGRSLDKKLSKLSLCDDSLLQHVDVGPDLFTAKNSCSKGVSGTEGVWTDPSDPGPIASKEAGTRGSLLLAIRAPCGRRFQQYFEPEDTLCMVRASAEAMFEAIYTDASIETMDVPRRSFKQMDMTLAQCGILNKSVLCISQNNDSGMEDGKA